MEVIALFVGDSDVGDGSRRPDAFFLGDGWAVCRGGADERKDGRGGEGEVVPTSTEFGLGQRWDSGSDSTSVMSSPW